VKVLAQLYGAAVVYYVGDTEAATRLVVRVGVDSIPGRRAGTLRLLADAPEGIAVATAAKALRCDENTARRELEDLTVLGLAERGKPVNRVIYEASAKLRHHAAEVFLNEFDPDVAMRRLFDIPSTNAPVGAKEGALVASD